MSYQRGFLLRHFVIATTIAAAATGISVPAGAQTAPDCSSRACASQDQIWVPAAQIHDIKNQFVAAVRQFTEAIAGSYGDERDRVLSSLTLLDRARIQWDAAIRVYEATLATFADTADIHIGLGTVYLDRARADDALHELAEAGRLDPRRADVHSLSALAYGLGNRSQDAARSLVKASALDGGNPLTLYSLAQQLIKSGQREQATEALRTFQVSAIRKSGEASGTSGPAAPFERVSLLRQVAGVAPIFPLQPYRQGFTLLLAGNYADAIDEFKRATAADPLTSSTNAPDAFVDAGAALRRGLIAPAIVVLEAAGAATSERSEARRLLGIAYWADEQYEKSVAQLSAAIHMSSGDERSRIALADVLVDAGRVDEAEQALKETVQAIPDSGAAHYRLGQIYQTRSLPSPAVHEFEAAAALTPLVGRDRLDETIGGLYVTQANFDSAVDAYVDRVDVNPNNADAHHKLGEIYFLQGRDDEALAEFVAALLIDPKKSDALSAACQVYVRMGRYADAVPSCRQALALDAGHKEAHYAMATALARLGQPEEAAKELQIFQQIQAEAMAIAQRQAEVKRQLLSAAERLRAGDYPAAAGMLQQAIAADSGSADVQRDLGIALMKAGRHEEAIQPLSKAVELEDRAELHQLLADAYKASGRLDESRAQSVLSVRAVERRKQERLRKMTAGR